MGQEGGFLAVQRTDLPQIDPRYYRHGATRHKPPDGGSGAGRGGEVRPCFGE